MKIKIAILFLLVTIDISLKAQGVGINETGANPNPSAGLDVDFNNKGFLPPRLTTAQMNAINNPATGLMVYNTSISCLVVNDGTPSSPIWNCISSSSGQLVGVISSIDCAGATNNGTLIAGEAASGVNSVISYTGGNGGFHSGQVVTSIGVTGLTATLEAGNFANGAGTLTYTITGTPTSVGTATFDINIGGQVCSLQRSVDYPTIANICNPSNPTIIIDVTNPVTGRTWMDRNLGANRAAVSSSDAESYGNLYQWGRGSDGHQCVNRYAGDGVSTSETTITLSNTDTPSHGDFIIFDTESFDWRSPKNDNLWQGVNGINNPCPAGYRLPTETEVNNERLSWVEAPISSTNTSTGAFASPLKLPMAGNRIAIDGSILASGGTGRYWSSTVLGNNSRALNFSSGTASILSATRMTGMSVRCFKD